MKKKTCSFVILSILAATPAFSANTVAHLTNKDYVDTGLRAVYSRAKAANATTQADLDETKDNLEILTLYVGGPATETEDASGLTAEIDALRSEVDVLNEKDYAGDGRGVSVVQGTKIVVDGLTSASRTDDEIYVFRNNIATKLDVADTWTPTAVEEVEEEP